MSQSLLAASATTATAVLLASNLVVALLFALAWAVRLRRSGYSRWWLLLGAVPVCNAVMLLLVAWTESPAEGRAKRDPRLDGAASRPMPERTRPLGNR